MKITIILMLLVAGIGCVDSTSDPTTNTRAQPVCNENRDNCPGGHPIPTVAQTKTKGRAWAKTVTTTPIAEAADESTTCEDATCVWHANLGALSLTYTCWEVETDEGWAEVCWGDVG